MNWIEHCCHRLPQTPTNSHLGHFHGDALWQVALNVLKERVSRRARQVFHLITRRTVIVKPHLPYIYNQLVWLPCFARDIFAVYLLRIIAFPRYFSKLDACIVTLKCWSLKLPVGLRWWVKKCINFLCISWYFPDLTFLPCKIRGWGKFCLGPDHSQIYSHMRAWNTGHLYTPEVCSCLVLDTVLLVYVHRLEKRVSLYSFWSCPATERHRDYLMENVYNRCIHSTVSEFNNNKTSPIFR